MLKSKFIALIPLFGLVLGCRHSYNTITNSSTKSVETETNVFCSKHKTLEAKYKNVHLILPQSFKPSVEEVMWRDSDKDIKVSIKIDNYSPKNLEEYSFYKASHLEEFYYKIIWESNVNTHDGKTSKLIIGETENSFIIQLASIDSLNGYVISCESKRHKDSELIEFCGKILSSTTIE